MLKLFALSFCILVLSSLNVKALSNIEGSKQGISSDGQPLHHPQGQGTSVGVGSSRRILRSPEPHSFYHGGQGGGSLEGLHHGGQFGVRGQGGRRIVRELGGQNQQSGLTKEEKVVGSQRLTREEHKKQQIEGQHSLNGRVSREPLSNDSPDLLEHQQPGLVGGQNRQLIHGNLRAIRETMNFVPKNAIESHRASRDQHGFVGKQFTSGIGGIEGPNLEPKGTRISRHQQLGLNQPKSRIGTRITRHQQMVENQPKGVRISGQNVD